MSFHSKPIKEVFYGLHSSERGLDSREAAKRIEQYGKNILKEKKRISPVTIFLNQFKSFIVGILIAAVIISFAIGESVDAIVIAIILVLNAVFGFIQEFRAEKAIEALKKMASLKAKVLRDGEEKLMESSEVVPGDVIILETGDKIPADARLFELKLLETQEAALTGESTPVRKDLKAVAEKSVLGDRVNMVFSGTVITNGKGKAIVTGTGMQTEIGKIAEMIQEQEEEPTHLQIKLSQLGRWIGILVLIICAIVFAAGVLKGEEVLGFFIVAVSLAVAAVPEGLPAVVTISLALGVQRMVSRHALIRKLPSVETLGSTTVICSDKTGTLTHNEMTVTKIYSNNKIVEISGEGYKTEGKFMFEGKEINPKEFELLLTIGALNNDSKLDEGKIIGDPTEGSLIVSAAKAGFFAKELEKKNPRLDEIPFNSERKRMSTIHGNAIYTKGAPDIIIEICDRIYDNGKIRKMTFEDKKKVLDVNVRFAEQALRVLGFAYAEGKEEKNLIFVGLQAMIDPPRKEAADAIARCKKAGIKVVMITGDHEITAKAIAKQLGLEGDSMNGQDIEKSQDLHKIVEEVSIYARVNPEHKLKIIEALKKNGHVVAMTGDGVNDAPALKKADIGIAMGITGTDVAKEASHMILTDDNFASIVNAVEEGRGIYDNIRKFVYYLLSCNLGEVLTIFIAIIIGMPLPLIAIMILWMNLVTDGIPALALGVEPISKGIMDRKPRNPKEEIITRGGAMWMAFVGVLMAAITLGVFYYYDPAVNLAEAQTMAFSTLVMLQLFNVLNSKSQTESIFSNFFTNKWLLLAILSSVLLQGAVIYTPLGGFFKTTALTLVDIWIVLACSASILAAGEMVKIISKYQKPSA